MSEFVRKLVKETWMLIGTVAQKEVIKQLDKEEQTQYIEAINRLEFDPDYAKEFGIGC